VYLTYRTAIECSVNSTGSATVNYPDILQSNWTVTAGQTVVSQCPSTVDNHGVVSRFDDGLTVRSSKCLAQFPPRMTALPTDCQGMTYT